MLWLLQIKMIEQSIKFGGRTMEKVMLLLESYYRRARGLLQEQYQGEESIEQQLRKDMESVEGEWLISSGL